MYSYVLEADRSLQLCFTVHSGKNFQNFASSRMPGNHIYGNGLPATFVPGRRNVCEGYWAVDES